MLMPIAHAGNPASNGQAGFLASLCSGNKIIFVQLELPSDNEQQPTTSVTNSKCPLCNIHAQDADIPRVIAFNRFGFENTHYNISSHDQLLSFHLAKLKAIRAPPTIS